MKNKASLFAAIFGYIITIYALIPLPKHTTIYFLITFNIIMSTVNLVIFVYENHKKVKTRYIGTSTSKQHRDDN